MPKPAGGLWSTGDRLLVQSTAGTGVELPIASENGRLPTGRSCAGFTLGILRGRPCYAVEAADQEPPPGLTFEGLRGLWTRLDEALIGVAGQALQLIEWDRNHGFCGRCGAPTQRRDMNAPVIVQPVG
jgi:NAD+ diphosphatase